MIKKTNFARLNFCLILIVAISLSCCTDERKNGGAENNVNCQRAETLLDSLLLNYSVPNSFLLREAYPFNEIQGETIPGLHVNIPNQYSYLWPYTATFAAVNAIYAYNRDAKYDELIRNLVLPGLEEYFDTQRQPHGYTSYVTFADLSDRYYDDNAWLGIEFVNLYRMTNNVHYLDKAKIIWNFLLSGSDKTFDGGIYWCEQTKSSKNTCSNAPVSVYAFKLFEVTSDSSYFHVGRELYNWTKSKLQDKTDNLYYDRINPNGTIHPGKFSYNSGQMMQSAVLQYKLTGDAGYLTDAQQIARSCYNYFFTDFTGDDGESFRMLKKGDPWFSAVMLRGYIELYHIDKNDTYLDAYKKTLNYAWTHCRDNRGLFSTDYSGKQCDFKKWLLTEAAMVEMYARLGGSGAITCSNL